MKHHLRVVAEVAVLGIAAYLPRFLDIAIGNRILNFFGSQGIDLRWVSSVVSFLIQVLPLPIGFVYGLRRQADLHFAAVWLGWAIGIVVWVSPGAYGLALSGGRVSFHGSSVGWLTPLLVLILALLVGSILPTLCTIWGQWVKRRLAEARKEIREAPGG